MLSIRPNSGRDQETCVANAGLSDCSPESDLRLSVSIRVSPEIGSRIPAWTAISEPPGAENLCSTRTCGSQAHRFPADANGGVLSDANDVGDCGTKNKEARAA